MTVQAGHQREHHWDAIRASLMLLGIPYHAALSYRPVGKDWIVQSNGGLPIFTDIAEFIHIFRMPAFFVIAGYFAAMLLARRGPGEWLRGRLMRLGVPFLATIVLLVPVMNFVCELSNLRPAEALASWRHESSTSGGYWVRHLWFIVVLLYCSAAAALLVKLHPRLATARLPQALDEGIARWFVPSLLLGAVLLGLWEAYAVEAFYTAGLATNLPQQILRIDELIAYAPFFILGALLQRAPAVLDRTSRFSPPIMAVAMVSMSVSLAFLDDLSPMVGRFFATIAALSLTQLIIAVARHVASRPHPLVDETVRASFTIYLFHMPIIVLLVALAAPLAIPVAVKAVLVMLGCFALSYSAWMVVRASPLLLFLFDGQWKKQAKAPPRRPAMAH